MVECSLFVVFVHKMCVWVFPKKVSTIMQVLVLIL